MVAQNIFWHKMNFHWVTDTDLVAQNILTQDEVLLGNYRHWSQNQWNVFNFDDLCSCVDSLWSTITQTWVNDVNVVIFSRMFLICQNSTLC